MNIKENTIQIKRLRKPTLEQFLKKHSLTLAIKEVPVISDYYINHEGCIKGLKVATDKFRPAQDVYPRGKSPDEAIRCAKLIIDGRYAEINGGKRIGPIRLTF